MSKAGFRNRGCGFVPALVLGAIVGGVLVALATRALPEMMSRLMSGMMAQMEKRGCDPAEM